MGHYVSEQRDVCLSLTYFFTCINSSHFLGRKYFFSFYLTFLLFAAYFGSGSLHFSLLFTDTVTTIAKYVTGIYIFLSAYMKTWEYKMKHSFTSAFLNFWTNHSGTWQNKLRFREGVSRNGKNPTTTYCWALCNLFALVSLCLKLEVNIHGSRAVKCLLACYFTWQTQFINDCQLLV